MNLSELIAKRRGEIIARWTKKVVGTIHPTSMPRLELVDHLPTFLDEIGEALDARESPDKSSTAAQHGLQRLGLETNEFSTGRGTFRGLEMA